MIKFETTLIEKGYIKHLLNCKTGKYEIPKNYEISTMGNLDYRYIHKSDPILEKIKEGKNIYDGTISYKDRLKVICVGLHEINKPVTLIYPRPKISVKRELESEGIKKVIIEDESTDDSMNLVLRKENSEEILASLFDPSISFSYDLVNKNSKFEL